VPEPSTEPPKPGPAHLRARVHPARGMPLARRLWAAGLFILLAVGVVLLVVAGPGTGGTSPGVLGGGHGSSPSADRSAGPLLEMRLPSVMRFPGRPARLPLPVKGEAAVVIPGLGVVGASPAEQEVPIASLTKMMTAYIILKDHPLSTSGGGPVFRMTAADHAKWVAAVMRDESNLEVKKGEKLDERQLLEALMIPSADNIADYLAVWDAGSIPRFVAKMNAEAAHLGLLATHYADASGFDSGSRSTAVDQAMLAGTAMANPVLRSIVDNVYVTLPVTGRIWNVYNPAIGVDGIIGIKSGFTHAAHACLATAAWRTVGGRRYLVVSTAVGMRLGLQQAAHVDEALLEAVSKELSVKTVVARGAVVARALARWDGRSVEAALSGGPIRLAGWPGLALRPAVIPFLARPSSAARAWPAGAGVGTLALSAAASSEAVGRVVLKEGLPPSPAGWVPPARAG
jgi:D-alanyl-D-alanine carboxypeptidase (penicillin-binding protein 5/6)